LAVVAGIAAGGINTIVGSGSLITFPTLLASVPVGDANVSNRPDCRSATSAAWSVTGRAGSARPRERSRPARARRGVGGVLLLAAESVFDAVVPLLILLASP
jgi:hypothetical protein